MNEGENFKLLLCLTLQVLDYFKRLTPVPGGSGPYSVRILDVLSITTNDDSDDNSVVDLFVASKDDQGVFLVREETLQLLQEMSGEIEAAFGPVIIDRQACGGGSVCLNGGQCSSAKVVAQHSPSRITEAGDTVFNAPVLKDNVTCQCGSEFGGRFCQVQKNPCSPNPCQEGQCVAREGGAGFRCLCPPLRSGERCEITKTDACQRNPCLNGAQCHNTKSGGFICFCRQG